MFEILIGACDYRSKSFFVLENCLDHSGSITFEIFSKERSNALTLLDVLNK